MKKFCVIGSPISHSKSPQIHEAGFSELEIEAEFKAIEVRPKELSNWVKDEFRSHFSGAAVTHPHKIAIRKLVDLETEAAQKIGAINTLFWQGKNLVGTNTDSLGILQALQNTINPTGKQALILGAGGGARATIFALQTAGAKIWIWGRSPKKAQELSSEFVVNFIEKLDQLDSEIFDLVINTTPVGQNEQKSILPADFWNSHHTALDLVYDPLETKFLQDASKAGAQIITGDQVLIGQALEQFRIWHGQELAPEIMETAFFG